MYFLYSHDFRKWFELIKFHLTIECNSASEKYVRSIFGISSDEASQGYFLALHSEEHRLKMFLHSEERRLKVFIRSEEHMNAFNRNLLYATVCYSKHCSYLEKLSLKKHHFWSKNVEKTIKMQAKVWRIKKFLEIE